MSCFIGNALEWFDFAIYGYLASSLGRLFFPTLDPYAALLSSYGVFAVAFIMRPVGAIFFGYLGDKWGRKQALIWSLGCMAIPTLMMGCLPVYDQIGVVAPLFLIACRMLQGLSVGGEFSGSLTYLTEHAPHNRKGYFSSWADLGSSIGMLMASMTILLLNVTLTESELLAWGWRLPFLASFIFAVLGYRLRQHLAETPDFLNHRYERRSSTWPLKEIYQKHMKTLILSISFLMVNSAGYYVLIVFIPNQNIQNNPSIYNSMTTLYSLLIMMPAMVWGGIVADRIGQIRCLIMGYTGCMILVVPLLISAKFGSFYQQLIWQGLFSFSLGFCFAPRSSLSSKIFPTPIRCSGVALSYNIGNAIFGGTAPLICALMIDQTGSILAPAGYIVGAAMISIFSVLLLEKDMSSQKRTFIF